ncbi:MAG TPA: hypothetical protein VNA14_13495 [Mycobacteriales bacterium]|nr:hypothetical protein [Mycobacteriales bacterium]
MTRRTLHSLGAAAIAFGILAAGNAGAASGYTLYLRQEGCGSTAEAGRLEPKKGADGTTGCGAIGGVPINEVIVQVDGAENALEPFDSNKKMAPVKLGSGAVTGTIAVASWIGVGGGVGFVDVDATLLLTTKAGKKFDLGAFSGSVMASPTETIARVPFTFAVPAAAVGQTITKVSLSYVAHGINVPMSAAQYDGESFLVLPRK